MSDRDKLIELIMTIDDGYSRSAAEYHADHLIANGVTVQRWIPVGERLPENDYGKHWKDRKQYLVMMSNGMYTVCRFGYKEYDWWVDRNDSVIRTPLVTGKGQRFFVNRILRHKEVSYSVQ